MSKNTKVALLSVILAVLGALILLIMSKVIGQQAEESVLSYFIYQIASLCVAALVVTVMYFAKGKKLEYLKLGNRNAKARPVTLLGIKKGDTWGTVGRTFVVIMTIATGVFLYFGYKDSFEGITMISWVFASLIAVPLSIMNAFNEEIITRWSIVEGMGGSFARYAPWVSLVVFGTVHYGGIPGGVIGSLMAGFLAWLLARSIQDTRGIGWAWFIHFCQDMLIFTVTIALFI